MKTMKKILRMACYFVLLVSLIGCSKKEDNGLTSKNSSTRTFDEYTMRMYNKYEKTNLPEFAGKDVYATKDKNNIVVILQEEATCTIPGYARMWKQLVEESGLVQESEIIEKECTLNETPFYSMSWNCDYNGTKCYMDTLYTINNGRLFMVWMICEEKNAEQIHFELETMASTIDYVGKRHLPVASDYPFVIFNNNFKITMQEGMYANDIQEMNTGQTEYDLSSENATYLMVKLYGLNDQYASLITSCFIELYNAEGRTAEKIAKDKLNMHENDSSWQEATMDQFFFEDVWPDGSDLLKGTIVFRVRLTNADNGMAMDNCYFDYNGNTYYFMLCYGMDYPETKDGIYNVINNLEIL